MMLLYVIGGIGVGLFFMMRARWVLWRHAAVWGVAVGADAGAGADQRVAARVDGLRHGAAALDVPRAAGGDGHRQLRSASRRSSALSFMAAETLTRRAFGASSAALARRGRAGRRPATTPQRPARRCRCSGARPAAYLLVSVFLAYDVMLYFFATKYFGWWSPVRGAAASGRARDLRAVALGDRQLVPGGLLGGSAVPRSAARRGRTHRRSFRPAPALPRHRVRRAGADLRRRSCAVPGPTRLRTAGGADPAVDRLRPALPRTTACCRASSCTTPSTWCCSPFPILLADAPGIWVQKAMIGAVHSGPVVGRARSGAWQVGRWTELSPADRNAAWTPPASDRAPSRSPSKRRSAVIGPRARTAWLAIGGVALMAIVGVSDGHDRAADAVGDRAQDAEAAARRALAERGVTLESRSGA